MFLTPRRVAMFAVLSAALLLPRGATAQVAMFQACSQGPTTNCAVVRLTSQLGIGPGGLNLFEIALQNLGSQSTPSLATSIYFLSFLTSQAAAAPGTEVDALATPASEGGATISDPSAWNIFDSGDALFLSALANKGVGGCAAGPFIGGFGQMGQTCGGDDEFISFSFFTSRVFDVEAITLGGLEIVGANGNADSCNEFMPCDVTKLAVVPEPGTMLLAITGFVGLAAFRVRRRKTIVGGPAVGEV